MPKNTPAVLSVKIEDDRHAPEFPRGTTLALDFAATAEPGDLAMAFPSRPGTPWLGRCCARGGRKVIESTHGDSVAIGSDAGIVVTVTSAILPTLARTPVAAGRQ